MEPDDLLCSRNARNGNILVERGPSYSLYLPLEEWPVCPLLRTLSDHVSMMLLPSLLVLPSRVPWLILDCARRTSTFLSCAFREQEDDQATRPHLVAPSSPCYDDDPMSIRAESGRTNLVAIGVLVGVMIAGVWVWKRLSLDTQEYVIDQAIPMAFAGLVIAAGLVLLVRAVNRRRVQRGERAKLMAAFERATVQEKKLEIAFTLIEVNGYRAEGLEPITPALRDLFATTLQQALGDKQHRIRGMAASYLGVLNDKTVIPLLLEALEDEHAYVRSCAALGLGRLRASEAKEKLTTVMEEDWDQTVRSRSKEALERIKQS